MKLFLQAVVTATMGVLTACTAVAGKAEDQLIDLVRQTYGVETLESLSIYSDYRVGNRGQGFTPEYSEFTPMRYETHVKLSEKKVSSENWDANYHFRSITTDDGVVEIDYMNNTLDVDTDGSYYGVIGGAILRSDTLLAYELVSQADNLVVKDTVNYLGTRHKVATLSLPGWVPLDLYINAKTGHITKLERPSRIGKFHFQFGNFKKNSNVTYGSDFSFFIDGHLSEITQGRRIEVNKVRPKAFNIENGLDPLRPKMDRPEMTIDQVGDDITYVGKGIGYTAFIDAGSYVIGVGATSGLSDRIKTYKAHKGESAKPLRYFVVDHHHEDHLKGLKDLDITGLTLLVPEIAVDSLQRLIGGPTKEGQIKIVSDKHIIGPTEIYNISTSHVAEFALVYVPAAKVVIQVDHMGALFADGPGFAKSDTLSLKSEIDRRGLDVKSVISLHNRKLESWQDFSAAIAAYNSDPCPSGRPICQ